MVDGGEGYGGMKSRGRWGCKKEVGGDGVDE